MPGQNSRSASKVDIDIHRDEKGPRHMPKTFFVSILLMGLALLIGALSSEQS